MLHFSSIPLPIVAPMIDPPALNKTTKERVDILVAYKSLMSSRVGPNMPSEMPCKVHVEND